jgi:hypothetical protein
MSYCRFGPDSDVYVFASWQGIECCACRRFQSFTASDAARMLMHLKAHMANGDMVPDYALERLRNEMRESPPTASGLDANARSDLPNIEFIPGDSPK